MSEDGGFFLNAALIASLNVSAIYLRAPAGRIIDFIIDFRSTVFVYFNCN